MSFLYAGKKCAMREQSDKKLNKQAIKAQTNSNELAVTEDRPSVYKGALLHHTETCAIKM